MSNFHCLQGLKKTQQRASLTRKVTRGGKNASLTSWCQADGNFPAHSRISPTLTRFIITENNKLEAVLMVEVKIRPFSILDKEKIFIILLSIIQHPFGVFTYFGDKNTTPVIVLSI